MKKLILITMLCVLGTCQYAQAQTMVPVTQAFIDDANSAFKEVVALRSANATIQRANDQLASANAANADAAKQALAANVLLRAENDNLKKLTCNTTSFFIFVVRIKRCK